MLPFLNKKSVAGLIISQRKPDEVPGDQETSDSPDKGLEACADDLIRCIHAKDTKGVMSALQAAFEIMDSQPHEEGPHTYEAQNAKAAKEQG